MAKTMIMMRRQLYLEKFRGLFDIFTIPLEFLYCHFYFREPCPECFRGLHGPNNDDALTAAGGWPGFCYFDFTRIDSINGHFVENLPLQYLSSVNYFRVPCTERTYGLALILGSGGLGRCHTFHRTRSSRIRPG